MHGLDGTRTLPVVVHMLPNSLRMAAEGDQLEKKFIDEVWPGLDNTSRAPLRSQRGPLHLHFSLSRRPESLEWTLSLSVFSCTNASSLCLAHLPIRPPNHGLEEGVGNCVFDRRQQSIARTLLNAVASLVWETEEFFETQQRAPSTLERVLPTSQQLGVELVSQR